MEPSRRRNGETLARISNGLVHLHTEFYGKGPERAKTYRLNDMVVCVLHDGLTQMERTLVESGGERTVHETRQLFQEARASAFRRVVEEATGRRVVAYTHQLHVNPDFAVEIFVLDGSDDVIDSHEHVS
jgi:uncharacterized protein YbcI